LSGKSSNSAIKKTPDSIVFAAHITGFAGQRLFDPLPLILSPILRIVHENLVVEEILAQFSLYVGRA
jgi:hypothetical protein